MKPILFTLSLFGDLVVVKAYSFFMILALIAAMVGIYYFLKKQGWSARSALFLLVVTGVSSFIGARLLHLLTNYFYYQKNFSQLFSISFTRFSILGGILFATLAAFVVCSFFKKDFWRAADAAAIVLGISIAITRVGCFLNGCCFGKETTLPWAEGFSFFSFAHQHQLAEGITTLFNVLPVHPTQLYEMVAALIGAGFAYWCYRKKITAGVAILGFTMWFCAFRLVNYYLRVLPATFDAPGWFYPVLYLTIIVASGALLIWRLKKKPV